MPAVDKRIWKRIWWSLFLRDRWAAVALGRPVLINLEDSDVPMITEDDFIEDEPGSPSPYPVNRIHSLYFIHAVKLSEIMGFVLRQHFSVDAENMRRRNKVPSVSHCDMAMVSWMQNLPNELKYKVKDNANHNFSRHCYILNIIQFYVLFIEQISYMKQIPRARIHPGVLLFKLRI